MDNRKCGPNTDRGAQGRFTSGNPGKPKGARHKLTRAIESLLEGEAEALTRKAIELALAGEISALKLCFERILPPRREPTFNVKLPKMRSAADIPLILSRLMELVGQGAIAAGEAERLSKLLEAYVKVKETVEFEIRLSNLESTLKGKMNEKAANT